MSTRLYFNRLAKIILEQLIFIKIIFISKLRYNLGVHHTNVLKLEFEEGVLPDNIQ